LTEHWNGQRWTAVHSPSIGTYDTLSAVCIISHNDAWAVGNSSPDDVYILMHWDGTSWSLVKGPPANGSALSSLKAFATDDVWAVGLKDAGGGCFCSTTFTVHWDGITWSEVSSPNVDGANYLNDVNGAAPDDVWAVGASYPDCCHSYNLALHWDGAVWSVVPTPVDNDFSHFYAVTAISSTNVIAVGLSDNAPSSARWDGTQWRVVPTPPVIDNYGFLFGISGHAGSVWAVGYQGFPSHSTSAYDLIFDWTR
jgi:hypothetical protein